MTTQTLLRYGAVALIATAVLFAVGGIALLAPGLSQGPIVPVLFYLGLIVAVYAFMALYAAQRQTAGRSGFAGFVLAVSGAILYSAPNYVLIAGTSGVQSWHDIWFFAMGQGLILLVGPPLFFLGMILLGLATARATILPRPAGILVTAGAAIWLVAYVLSVVPALLTAATLLLGAGLAWVGYAMLAPSRAGARLATH